MPPVTFGYHSVPRGQGHPALEPHPSHTLMVQDAQRAEQLGFDAIWAPDHFYFERPSGLETFPEGWTLLTAIAMSTERVRLGHQVLAASFRHPALLAKMAGALQELSGGRLILGIGAGNQAHEHNAFGLDFEHRVGRLKEYLPILIALMSGETITFKGRYFTLREASLRTFVPRVPIWIAAGGEQMLALTAKCADGWNAAGGVGWDPANYRARLDGLEAACRAIGRDPKSIELSHMSFLGIAPDATSARETLEALAADAKTTPEALAQRTFVGTPDQIADAMRRLVDVGVSHFVCVVNRLPHPECYMERVELLAREVFPRVREQC
ncbi:MAG: LLM class flavin-dependent oxidoreductase [Chloroflexi bacterium]|nr:LLM class flavin-dependent oxidoreductase [Chloroflexota bacterium]